MTLVVENKDITKNFIPYIKKRMFGHLSIILNTRKLSKYDEYFNSEKFNPDTKLNISSRNIILLGMSNLSHKRYESTTHIFINPNIKYPGSDFKIVDLCKIINFGTLSIDAYPIFTQTFSYFSRNIKHYIDKYIIGLG